MFIPTQSYTPNLTVQRAPHTHDYSVIQNAILHDEGLSDRARHIAEIMLSFPTGWKIIPTHIGKILGLGVNTIYKYLRELADYGLLVRTRLKNEFGRWSGYDYFLIEPTVKGEVQISNPVSEPVSSTYQKMSRQGVSSQKNCPLINTEINKYLDKEVIIDLSPTSLKPEADERDLWSFDFSDPETIEAYICLQIEAPEITSTTLVSSGGESSAASYKKPTLKTTEPNCTQRRTAQDKGTWLERGRKNGLWQSKEELDGFMVALHRHAAKNPRLELKGNWVDSVVEKTCTNGAGTHWIEYTAELGIGTMDKQPWSDIDGNVDPSFKSYVEQSKFGESGNSTSRAVELAAQVFANPAQCLSMWNEYQRRLERELEEKAKCDRLGVTYDAPGVLKPKVEISADRTAETQQVLRIDTAPQIDLPFIAAVAVAVLESESESESESEGISEDEAEAYWDTLGTESDVKLKMLELGLNMSISKLQPQATPLSDAYREPKPIDQVEVKEFNVWVDSAKAKKLISTGFSESGCLFVMLADDLTVMPWKEARNLFGTLD